MSKEKIYLQCGYEDKCKRDCLNCSRKGISGKIVLTQAEMSVIEDFAVCDLDSLKVHHEKERDLMQKIMYRIMQKIFKIEKKNGNKKDKRIQ